MWATLGFIIDNWPSFTTCVTFGEFEEHILSPNENYKRLTIQPGLWVAFQGLDKGVSILLNIIPEPHSQNEADSKPLESINYIF